MKPYLEYETKIENVVNIQATCLQDIQCISIESNNIVLHILEQDSIIAGTSHLPILDNVIADIEDWKSKIADNKSRKYSFNIAKSIRYHEKRYMQTFLNV